MNLSIINPVDKDQPPIGHGCFQIGKIRRAFEHALQLITIALVKNDPRVPLLSCIKIITAKKISTKKHMLFNREDDYGNGMNVDGDGMDEGRYCSICDFLGFPITLQITHNTDRCMFDTRNPNFNQSLLDKAMIKYEKHINKKR